MASIQARHTRTCALGPRTTSGPLDGCDCRPTWYVVSRVDSALVRDKVEKGRDKAHDRALAEKKLRTIEVHIDEGRYQPPQSLRFEEFADEWLKAVRRRSTTIASYGITLRYAKAVFGRKRVDKLTVSDVTRFLAHIERVNAPVAVSESTLAKHLRQLGACFAAAPGLERNPVRQLDRSRKPKAKKATPNYFTSEELRRLWPALTDRPIHLTAFKLLATTGMRFGELAGLRWSDVRLLDGELDVRRQFTAGQEVERPKDVEPRVVHLVPEARRLLETWYEATGDDGLVFENEEGRHLDDSRARKLLYAAMKRAAIPRIGESGGKRTIHSLRDTYARACLEAGAPLDWLKDELGHSSITVTVDTYGKWAKSASRQQAALLEGAFAV